MRMPAIMLAVLLLFPAAVLAGNVYKCPTPEGGTVYSDTPCHGQAKPLKVQKSDFGEAKYGAEIRLSQTSCNISRTGYGEALGYIHNTTPDAKTVRVTATFIKGGTVADTVTLPFKVPAFGRTPFSIMGSPVFAERCEYQYAWD